MNSLVPKTLRAREIGISRCMLYYKPKRPDKDWQLKCKIEEVLISRSAPGCPWENGYQESFYSQFKVDLGDPSRFKTLGELVFAIYQTVWTYNNTRIHSALKMSPVRFALKASKSYN